jgi:hypothetical protein
MADISESESKFTISNGDRVWVPISEGEDCYRVVRVKEKQTDMVHVFDDDYKSWTVKIGMYTR